jgi:signal transduction histidine kinase/ActR/RegA family two-component response regulator
MKPFQIFSFRNLPIRYKFLISSSLILVLISSFIFFYYPAEHKKNSLILLKNKIQSMSDLVALVVGVGMSSNDFQAINEALNWAKMDKDLAYIKVLSTSNEELGSHNPDGYTINKEKLVLRAGIVELDGILHRSVPLLYGNKSYGTLLMGFSLKDLNTNLVNNRKTTIFVCASIFVLGTILSLLFAGMVTKSLLKLKNAANEAAEGEYDTKIVIDSSDEVGQLGQTMKVMLEKINNSMNEAIVMNKELEAARDLAQEASTTKSRFLSSVSHELRTPLNAIIGFSELGLEFDEEDDKEELFEDQISNLKQILSAGQHLLTLINEILDLAAVESGKTVLSIEPVGLEKLLEDVISLTQPQAEKYGIKLENRIQLNKKACVLCDQTRLKQVLLNLISNAIKYNSEAGTVTLSTEMIDLITLRINVSDTGPGIPLEKQKYLFDPFSRLGSENTNTEGTGIGLTITKKLVELMGGAISFDSKIGVGTCFYVDFKVSSELEQQDPAFIESVAVQPKQIVKREGKFHILYIEDNVMNTQLVQKVLKKNRPEVELLCADHARKGIELAVKNQPDLILMDIQLPEIDGIQAFKKLRTFKETRDIPVIALSANAMKHQVEEVMSLGFKLYMTKPINIHKLLNTIDQFEGSSANLKRPV